MKVIKGLQGVVVADSTICKIDGEKGKLIYRGYDIKDLAKHSSFEEVTYLLWFGTLPKKSQLSSFKTSIRKQMDLPVGIKKIIKGLPRKTVPMAALRTIVSALSLYDVDAEDISVEANRRKAIRILAAMPSMVAAIERHRQGKSILKPKKNLSLAANFLYMMNGKVPDSKTARTMDIALLLHAEHGMNASTFTSRVVVSTLSDLHSGLAAAISTLKGPLHGGANTKALQAFHDLGDKLHVRDHCDAQCRHDVDKHVLQLLKEHKRIMGIGHRVYKVKDPRAKILEAYAKKVGKDDHKYYEMAQEIEKVMQREKGLYANVDFFSGIVYDNLGIRPELYVCLFAMARTAGWIAHMLEQYETNRLIRPTINYKGDLNKKYRRRR